jgi:26S proteasome subunit RPN6 C-terminal helix domain
MILDKVFHGVLDQGRGCLLVFDEPEEDGSYGTAIEMLEEVGKVVDSLYAKVRVPVTEGRLRKLIPLHCVPCFVNRPQKLRSIRITNDTEPALHELCVCVINPIVQQPSTA